MSNVETKVKFYINFSQNGARKEIMILLFHYYVIKEYFDAGSLYTKMIVCTVICWQRGTGKLCKYFIYSNFLQNMRVHFYPQNFKFLQETLW